MAKTTLRRCIGCRRRAPPGELLRVVYSDRGGLLFDAQQRLGGRGAYVHRSASCWRAAADLRRWQRALRLSPQQVSAQDFSGFLESLAKEVLKSDGETGQEAAPRGAKIRL